MDTKEVEDSVKLTLMMARALQQNGIPAHRMEESVNTLCKHLGMKGDVFNSPGGLIMNIGKEGQQSTHFVKVAYGDLNLEKLDKIDKLYKNILSNKTSTTQAISELTLLGATKKRYSGIIEIIFLAISTSSAARVFGGGYAEIMVSFVIGLFIGMLIFTADYFPRIGNMIVVLSSVFASAFAKLALLWFGNFSVDIATIAGLILLIPGFSFTVSIIELVNGHPIAGTARFANTILTLLMIGLGIAIGSQIDQVVNIIPNQNSFAPIPSWTIYIALITVPLGFVVLFKAIPKDFIWILLACLCSYYSLKYASHFVNAQLAVFAASLALGLISNLFSLWQNRPVSIMLVPGIILLVPGSLGYRSITELINNQTLSGIETAFSMTITAIALASGLVVSNILLSSKRAL